MFSLVVTLLIGLSSVAAAGAPNTQEPRNGICIQVIAYAKNLATGEVRQFPTPCDIPKGWEPLPFGYREEERVKELSREPASNKELPKKFTHLKGRILLQVQSRGEAWYVHPQTGQRSSLGRPADAFALMRAQGLGISEKDFARLASDRAFAQRLSGRILLRVEKNGEAYFLDSKDRTLHSLGRPSEAFDVMQKRGLGVTNTDLEEIPEY